MLVQKNKVIITSIIIPSNRTVLFKLSTFVNKMITVDLVDKPDNE